MKKFTTVSILFFVFALLPIVTSAQNKVKMEPVNKDDKKETRKQNEGRSDTLFIKQLDINTKVWKNIRPTIQLFYLRSVPSLLDEEHKDFRNPFKGEFANGNAGEIKLGTVYQNMVKPDHGIAEYEFNGVFFKYMGPNEYMENDVDRDQYNLKLIQFGFSNTNGYGWQSKSSWFGIYLYTGSGLNWTNVSYTVETGGDESSNEALNTFDGDLRFGQTWESGLRMSLIGPLNIIGGYEQNIIFPRHLFWKWAVSGLIEGVGIGLLGAFSNWIMDEAPAAGPVVNWALKTGAYYILYKLRTEDMNWPFETAPPLVIDSWKIGLSLEF
jgi:hypothetical protein